MKKYKNLKISQTRFLGTVFDADFKNEVRFSEKNICELIPGTVLGYVDFMPRINSQIFFSEKRTSFLKSASKTVPRNRV